MLAGLLIAIFVGILLSGRNFIFKKIDEGIISTNNIEQLLAIGSKYHKWGKYDKSLEAYSKVLRLDPHNLSALVSKAFILFNKNDFNGASEIYKKIHEYYFENNFEKYALQTDEHKNNLSITMYRYGYILHLKGDGINAEKFKNISFANQFFVDNYKNLRSQILY